MRECQRKLYFKIIVYFIISIIYCTPCFSCQNTAKNKKENWKKQRQRMVNILKRYNISDALILKAMNKVPRHRYIPSNQLTNCSDPYGDHPCPIGYSQTISQPYIVAYMVEKLKLKPEEKVLEIGTGSGYQTAILAELKCKVYSIELIKELYDHAARILKEEGYKSVKLLHGDGYEGWKEHAPYEAIIVTCAPKTIPPNLVSQLKDQGRMILPVGSYYQRLVILRKKKGRLFLEKDLPVRFVPMVKK